MASIKPLSKKIFVEFEPYVDRKTKSGLHLHITEKEGVPYKGTVRFIADDVDACKVGDRIAYCFKHLKPRGVELEGVKYMVVHNDDVVGLIT